MTRRSFGYTDFRLETIRRTIRWPHLVFSHQISITSLSGCGSSSTLALLQERLGMPWRYISGGSIMRAQAALLGKTIEEFARHNREHPEDGYDYLCDKMVQDFATQNFVVGEGRLTHAFMPRAYRVLLEADIMVRAERRQKQYHPDLSVEQVAEMIARRDIDDDGVRYDRIRPGWNWPKSDFHDVIDTSLPENTVDVVVDRILQRRQLWLQSQTVLTDVLCE